MVGSIGSIATSVYQNYTSELLSGSSTSQSISFDELISSGVIKTKEEPSLGVNAITATPSMEKSSASSSISDSSNSDMDLNKDGQVTSDEVIRYLQMQMVDRMSEELSSEEGVVQMGQQANNLNGLSDFKNKLACSAYKLGENALNVALTSATQNFVL